MDQVQNELNPSGGGPLGGGGVIDLRAHVDILRRRAWVAGPVGGVVALVIFAFAIFSPPSFQATAKLLLSPQVERVAPSEDLMSGAQTDASSLASELEVLRSRPLAEQVVAKLSLVDDPEWNRDLREEGFFGGVVSAVGGALAAPFAAREDVGSGGAGVDEAVRRRVVNAVLESYTVRRRNLSYVIELTVTAGDPAKAAQVANALVDAYLESQLNARYDAAQRANTWLSGRLQSLQGEVQAKEAAVERYRAENGLVEVQGSSLAEQQVTTLQASIIEARAELAQKEARLSQVRQLGSGPEAADAIASLVGAPEITELRRQESETIRRQADLESRYAERHPDVQNVRLERADLRRRIDAEIARIEATLQNEVMVARTGLASLESSTSSMKGEILGNNRALIRLRELQRDAEATRAVYESFLKRFEEIDQQGTLQITNARLVEGATAPRVASSPNLPRALAIALAVGLLLGVGLAYLIEMFDDVLGSAEEVLRKVGVPALTAIPVVPAAELKKAPAERRSPEAFLVDRPMSVYAEALRVLRTTVLYANVDVTPKVIAITSAAPNEGKTTTSVALARTAAAAGQRVLLLDCDLRRHSLTRILDGEPAIGLLQVLAGQAEWRGALVSDPDSDVHILPATQSSFTPQDVFGSESMARLINEVKLIYDLVVLDCAPVLAVAETRVVARRADMTIVVARFGQTPAKQVRSAVNQLQLAGASVAGVVVNCLNPDKARGGYYDAPYYSKAYSGYYRDAA